MELQANTSLVEIDLEVGNYRYLELVLADQEHTNMPNIQPFIVPCCPSLLIIPLTVIPIKAFQLKE